MQAAVTKRFATLTAAALLAMAATLDAAPLFEGDTAIRVTLKGPLTTLMRERSETEQLPFVLTLTDADGSAPAFDVKLRTRGNYRRDPETCSFAPVRLNFKKKQVKDTIFAGQDKLKLVTHCMNRGPGYKAAVQREYLAYRVFNLLSDASYRVRLLEITWIDTDKSDQDLTRFGFVIEDTADLAARIGREELEIEKTTVAELDPAYTNLMSVFQYFIANTDFSPIAAAPGRDCCHNSRLMAKADELLYAVPYDFDMSGFVYAPYATPNPRFKLRTVKQRLYRGRCVNNGELTTTLKIFADRRADIRSLIQSHPYLDDRERRDTLRFVDNFYRVIDDPRTLQQHIVNRCLN
jgi:hypothetical protein